MSSHRRDVRPRYGRIAVLATSVTISAVAALAGAGVLATGQSSAVAKPASYDATRAAEASIPDPTLSTSPSSADAGADDQRADQRGPDRAKADAATSTSSDATAVPADSGTGRRVVFSQHLQRVWLIGGRPDDVQRTYLVSGSVTHNLVPGTYAVYSRSRWAVGVEDSGVMQYFVRFTQGPTGAAIGFHTIPTKNGVPLQSQAQLGTPESHGCIRQATPDAVALWDFAPVGTKVVVVA